MEAELERLLGSPRAYKEEKPEIVAVNVEEDDIAAEGDGIEKEASTQAHGTTAGLVKSIKKNMSLYVSRDSSPVCIYQVPAKLRSLNEKAFTPQSVSIGPIHHGKPELKLMQRYKWRFFDKYLTMMSISLDQLATAARDMENQVRECYQESFDSLGSNEFSEMIMLDAIFLIMFLREHIRNCKGQQGITRIIEVDTQKDAREIEADTQKDPNLPMALPLGHPTSPTTVQLSRKRRSTPSTTVQVSRNEWVKSVIIQDLMLLENQIPFFVLEHFSKYLEKLQFDLWASIPILFKSVGNVNELNRSGKKARHLVDFLQSYYKPQKNKIIWGKTVYNRSATELQEAGVKFKGVPNDDILRMRFDNGSLEIPILRVDGKTEILFRNMIAFEQCHNGLEKFVTSYIIFMDSLINTAKDVDLLVECGVITNSYGDHERVGSLFNNLHKEIEGLENEFYFSELCTRLNDYSKTYWHQWMAKWFRAKKVLRRDYFNSPWSTISVIAAVILLVLTVVQTVCSIVSIL